MEKETEKEIQLNELLDHESQGPDLGAAYGPRPEYRDQHRQHRRLRS